jgi:Fe-S cluster assembly protein SufD
VEARGAEWSSLRAAPNAAPALGDMIDLKLHPLAALATALLDDGIVIRVPAGVTIAQPIPLAFVSAAGERPALSTPRVRIEAGRGSSVAILQEHSSSGARGAHFTNAVSEILVGASAHVELTLVQRENDDTFHASNTAVRLEQGASFTSHVVTLGGRLTRNDLAVVLAGEGAECALHGLYLGTGERLVDNHSLVDHAVPHGTSRQLYKGVLGDTSQGVFRGRVIVRPGAQQTNAAQSNANLLVSDGAEIDSKPQLEIWADDVKCSHGSSIGRLDEEALFYLRSRGLGEREARGLLTLGFAAQLLNALPGAALRDELSAELARRLAVEVQT